jgi:hypothetical protein
MIDPEEVEVAWRVLETRGLGHDQVRVRQLDVITRHGRVLLGIDELDQHHLLLPVASGTVVDADTSSGGVQIRAFDLMEGGSIRSFADVMCTKPHLNEMFSLLLTEIAGQITATEDRPDQIARRVLEKWRELLALGPSLLPPLQSLTGLFGELHCLRELVRRSPAAQQHWVGPSHARHDFVTPWGALEVKTTRAREATAISMSSVDQLLNPPDGPLFLAVLQIEEHPTAGSSIPVLIDEMIALGAAAEPLLRKIAEYGLPATSLPKLRGLSFVLKRRIVFRIQGAFPRVIPESFVGGRVPHGVLGLRYDIDLAVAEPLGLAEAEVTEAFDLLAGLKKQ